jgi:archaellum biogenesis ATPase FlaH
MFDKRFSILGTGNIELVGRSNILDQILTSICKPVPDHLQVVGPRYAGKTVLLNKLKSIVEEGEGNPYSSVVLWDLGHGTPNTDLEFLSQFAKNLAEAIERKYPEYAEHLLASEDTLHQDIGEVLDAISDETKVLVILDGFDKPLSSDKLTRNLWDQLRELAQKKSLTLITASRKTLRELIRNPEAQTSDFWNIFLSTPVRVNCFEEEDIAEILTNECGVEYEKGALTELYNCTNGNPIVLFEMLNYLLKENNGEKITNTAVLDSLPKSFESSQNYIDALWHDCSPSTQDTIRLLNEQNQAQGVCHIDSMSITEKGFARNSGSKLIKASRILQMYLNGLTNETGSIDRLFQTPEAYTENFNSVIAKRLKQIPDIDPTLNRYLQRSLEDLPNHPDVCLSGIRGIVDQCFDMIWNAEFGGKTVPDGHFDIWRYNGVSNDVQDFKTSFPQGAKRIRLLKVLTGADRSNPLAQVVSKSTCVALNSIYPYGDFGQHQEGENMSLQMVYSAMLLAVELVASLQYDLAVAKDSI